MATRELYRHLDRLERTAFEPIRRQRGGRIDYDFYAERARRERDGAWRRGPAPTKARITRRAAQGRELDEAA